MDCRSSSPLTPTKCLAGWFYAASPDVLHNAQNAPLKSVGFQGLLYTVQYTGIYFTKRMEEYEGVCTYTECLLQEIAGF